MRKWKLQNAAPQWKILSRTNHSVAAIMTVNPGEPEGGPENRHKTSDQWLFVLGGSGSAIVNRTKVTLKKGALLLIKAGEAHEIKSTKRSKLRTVNFYGPDIKFAD